MATTRQFLRILRLSLLLNLIHFSMGQQIDSLHQSPHPVLCPEDIGIFHPDIPDVHGPGPVVTVGRDLVYRDIYTWLEILSDLADVHSTKDITQVVQRCLRGSAATWWVVELTSEERKELQKASLQRWSSALIERFGLPTHIAFWEFLWSRYTTQDLDYSPRIWIHQIIQYAKATERYSYTHPFQIWNRFAPNLQRDIPMPNSTTTIIDLLEKIDEMYPTWAIRYQGSYGGCQHNALRDASRLYGIAKSPYHEFVEVVTCAVRGQANVVRGQVDMIIQRVFRWLFCGCWV